MHARIGMPVDSTDGHWGELDDLIVDPTNWHLTHLVVQPHHHHERSRLVALSDVATCDDRLVLTLSAVEIESSPVVESTEFVRIDRQGIDAKGWDSDALQISAWPYFASGGPAMSLAGTGLRSGFGRPARGPRYAGTKLDHIPAGEIEIRRSSHVHSCDDHRIGSVDGFVVDDSRSITHLVLDHGHLWAHREITIPIAHVVSANRDDVNLDVTRSEVGNFPAVSFHRPGRAGVAN